MRSDLFRAAESGHVPTIQNLYDQDSDVLDQVTFQGDSALHIAARKSHLHLVTWILDRQPSLAQLQNKDKNRPLHEAAKSGNRELVETLLPHKQRYVYDCNEFGETALTIASKYGHVETVRLLLQTKSNEPGFETKSPFDRDLEKIEWELSVKQAAYRGYRDIVVAMLGHPVKPMKLSLADKVACAKEKLINIIDDRSDHIRAKYWHTQIPFQSILKTPFLHTAVQGGHLVVVEAILNHDLWSNDYMTEKDEYGRCAVHVAAMKGHWDIINQFISKRADCVDIRSSDHKSVLHFAVIYNQVDDVQHLLRERDPETVRELLSSDHSCFGNTALHLAAIYGVNRQLLECLLSPPAVDVNALNAEGKTALDIASDKASAAAQHNPNYDIIVQKLEAQGGIRSSLIPKSNTTSDPSNDSKQGRAKDTVNTNMVVASLIATVTFAAIFQIPGGIEDDKESKNYGAARLACHPLFTRFLISDILAFSSSVTVILSWLLGLAWQWFPYSSFGEPTMFSYLSALSLPISIMWTVFAFVAASYMVIVPIDVVAMKIKHGNTICIYSTFMRYGIYVAIFLPLSVASGYELYRFIILKSQLNKRFLGILVIIITFFIVSMNLYIIL